MHNATFASAAGVKAGFMAHRSLIKPVTQSPDSERVRGEG